MNHDDPLDFGPYQPRTYPEALFMYWAKNLVDGIHLVSEYKQGTNENYGAVLRYSTLCSFALYQAIYKEKATLDIGTFYVDFLLPSLENFERTNDEFIIQIDDRKEQTGPKQALSFLEELVHTQRGHVSDDELQEQWEALLHEGDLLHASQAHREHIENIVHKHRISGHIPGDLDIDNLFEELHDKAIHDAHRQTGPDRKKKRGKNAGQPKKLDDAFGWNSVTEHLKDVKDPGRITRRAGLTGEQKEQILLAAPSCCTDLQLKYVQMHLGEGRTIRDIACSVGKSPSTVWSGYRAGLNRIFKQ